MRWTPASAAAEREVVVGGAEEEFSVGDDALQDADGADDGGDRDPGDLAVLPCGDVVPVGVGDVLVVPAADQVPSAGAVEARPRGRGRSSKDSAAQPSLSSDGPPPGSQPDRAPADDLVRLPISIYLTENSIHRQVETAVDEWLTTADASIRTRDEPVIASWFRRMEAGVKRAARTLAGREAVLTAKHVADSRLIQAQDAYVTATLLQNVGPVLQALQPTKDAVVRAGALLIVKIDWVVQVHQLTAAQQAILDHQPHLVASPKEIAAALQLSDPAEAALPSSASRTDYGGAATAVD
jgi:hypothetical protein